MGSSFFLKLERMLSLSPCVMSPCSRPTGGEERPSLAAEVTEVDTPTLVALSLQAGGHLFRVGLPSDKHQHTASCRGQEVRQGELHTLPAAGGRR